MAQKKFVVTGATGHTGSCTVERLLERTCGSPAKHHSSREVFVRHLQKMTSTTRKEN